MPEAEKKESGKLFRAITMAKKTSKLHDKKFEENEEQE